ncbi:MAG: hypothetical protein ABI378_07715 [Chitinophagaceae bacterium]
MNSPAQTLALFQGECFLELEIFVEKFKSIRAFVFDWDGVFNDGKKDEKGSSPFSEIDAMGTNLLRFNYHLGARKQAVVAVISGEHNHAAKTLATREHFHAVYSGIKHKAQALEHLCATQNLEEHEVAFVFDDVLDFSLAARCGLRIMVQRDCNPLLIQWAVRAGYVDYLTGAAGENHAVREAVELMMGLSGIYDETIQNRATFSPRYQQYLEERNQTETQFFSVKNSEIVAQ